MTLKVIGAGLGRTGTMSLKLALEALGFGPCYHMIEVFKIPEASGLWERVALGEAGLWEDIFKGFAATVDWPSATYYEALAALYPDAKIILTDRDPDDWFKSTQNTIFKDIDERWADPSNVWGRMARRVIGDMFDGRMHDRDHAISVFNAHNARVREVIPRARLLEFQADKGWAPLCGFLGVPVPEIPYPKVNTTEDFAAKVSALRDRQASS